ncbi:hypothetical protein CSE16_00990 [Solibacillus sp. R5-41]|uniref:hypothetical protein n=1 Tax=Solibacillus sp. R5-41 TaxID=2048654 RepID=UPI000C12497B|nr:hypothetical protein [Solibacillus sp. R5-41]ATP38719.1 hypothetical protein CSE16_00990 [Solibacillus sp. R5-41]
MKRRLLMLCIPFVFAGCAITNTQTIIDWVDFVKLNDSSYYGIYETELASPDFLGEVASVVKFKLDENVTTTSYKSKNGDAAFHEKGTKIYAVKGLEDVYAVQSNYKINGYQIYFEDGNMSNYRFDTMSQDEIKKVELYKLNEQGGYKLLSMLNEQTEIQSFLAVLNASEEKSNFKPKMIDKDPTYFEMVFYSNAPIAHRYGLQYDGETYYWHPWETAILDEKIGEYFKE